jgi:two-component system sensor histidine kinase BarA
MKILIVDDEKIIGGLMCKLLTDRKHSPEHVSTAEEAIEKARENPYDLIIMDYRIIGSALNGLQATGEIRKLPNHAKTPVYMCSSDNLSGEQLSEAGANGSLPKEFPLLVKNLDALLTQLQKQETPKQKQEAPKKSVPSYRLPLEYQDPLDRISGPGPLDRHMSFL